MATRRNEKERFDDKSAKGEVDERTVVEESDAKTGKIDARNLKANGGEMKKAKLLWVDLEMTGLEPEKDKILEVAAVATDMKLNEIARFRAVVKVPEELMRERMVGQFWEKNAKSRDGLVAQNGSGRPAAEVEKDMLKFLDENFGKEIYLAGNSIHQDRKFIEREMPEWHRRMHYRMLDVSAWKIYFEQALGKKFTKPENHRAEDDVAGSIEEFRWYLTFLNGKKDKRSSGEDGVRGEK